MKIIYEKCGVKNYMKEDHRRYKRNFCTYKNKAWKKAGKYGNQTFDLRHKGALHYHLN